MTLRKRILAALVMLLAVGVGLAVASPASASTPHVVVINLDEPLPAGMSVEPAKTTAPGGVTPNLGGCLQEELCVWTDSLGPSQPAGYLYRWNASWKGSWLTLTGNWYLSVSFIQNRGANTTARAQMSCPYIFPDATSGWINYGSYKSLAGMIINDGAKCMNWSWV